jgi:hypothetical protein
MPVASVLFYHREEDDNLITQERKTMKTENNTHFSMLIQSLQLLATCYEHQINALPTFVDVPDEVALTFSETLLLADPLVKEGLITSDQQAELKQLDALLEHMSDNKNLWSLTSLQTSPEWEHVRHCAENILKSFQISKEMPNLFWVEYIPGRKEPS